MLACQDCGFESLYQDEVVRYDNNGFELSENQDDCHEVLCIECADKKH